MAKKKIFWVDIPKDPTLQADKGEWQNIDSFDTKEEAIAFIREWFGECDEDGRLLDPLIAQGEDDEDEEEHS